MSLTVSDWFYEGILMDGGLLAIDPAYFSISGGRERWLYRVARKHAGGAGPEGFAISMPTLFEKSGAEGTYRRFKFEMLAIFDRNDIPGFDLQLETGRGEPSLRMVRKDQPQLPKSAGSLSKTGTGQGGLTSSIGTPAAPLLSDRTIALVRRDFPGLDVYAIQSDYDAWIANGGSGRIPDDYQKGFYGFARQFSTRYSR
jgi:hypothetical protein